MLIANALQVGRRPRRDRRAVVTPLVLDPGEKLVEQTQYHRDMLDRSIWQAVGMKGRFSALGEPVNLSGDTQNGEPRC